MVKIHVFQHASNKIVTKRLVHNVPRIGDEIRIAENTFYKVVTVIWCMDENDATYERANIGVV